MAKRKRIIPLSKEPVGYGRIKALAKRMTDEMDEQLKASSATLPRLIVGHLCEAAQCAIQMTFPHRTPPDQVDFAHWVAYLESHGERASQLWANLKTEWPHGYSREFAHVVGNSAASATFRFIDAIHQEIVVGGLSAFSGYDREKLPATDERFAKWRDLTIDGINTRKQPWPAGWAGREIHQKRYGLLIDLDHEASLVAPQKHENDDSYVLASVLWAGRKESHKVLKRKLEKSGVEHHNKGQRLFIHAAQWANLCAKLQNDEFESLDREEPPEPSEVSVRLNEHYTKHAKKRNLD